MVKQGKTKEAQVPPKSATRRKTEDADTAGDGRVVIQVRVRRELRRLIKQLADHRDETVQTFILRILRESGVPVTDDDLLDRRKSDNRVCLRAPAKRRQDSEDRKVPADAQSLAELLTAALAQVGDTGGQSAALTRGGCVVIVNAGGNCKAATRCLR
jgi:uncharacterized protein (DUF1778 family)